MRRRSVQGSRKRQSAETPTNAHTHSHSPRCSFQKLFALFVTQHSIQSTHSFACREHPQHTQDAEGFDALLCVDVGAEHRVHTWRSTDTEIRVHPSTQRTAGGTGALEHGMRTWVPLCGDVCPVATPRTQSSSKGCSFACKHGGCPRDHDDDDDDDDVDEDEAGSREKSIFSLACHVK